MAGRGQGRGRENYPMTEDGDPNAGHPQKGMSEPLPRDATKVLILSPAPTRPG
jgi:hypothetical protein